MVSTDDSIKIKCFFFLQALGFVYFSFLMIANEATDEIFLDATGVDSGGPSPYKLLFSSLQCCLCY